MNWLLYFAAFVVGLYVVAFGAMWLRYIVAINYECGGWYRLLAPLAIKAGVFDILLNYTLFALAMWSKPAPGEYTISKHMERLVTWKNRRGAFCRWLAKYVINPWDHVGGPHIPGGQ